MKFVHAADLHIDSPLCGLERYEGAPVERVCGATRRALENLVELWLAEEAAFPLLAGDIFDGDWRDYGTRETGPKGATLVTVRDGRVADVEARALDVVRWTACEVEVMDVASSDDAIEATRARNVVVVATVNTGIDLPVLRGLCAADGSQMIWKGAAS